MTDLHQMKESKRYPGLFVLKYKNKVFYDNLWNDDLIEMRGRVVDAQGNTVINPFTKIFNRFENKTDIDRDEEVLAIQKINGFMAAITYVPKVGASVVSTTGSLDSDFVALAEKHLDRLKGRVADMAKRSGNYFTFLFEIVDESDPHIIKEKPGAYLLGLRHINSTEAYKSSPETEMFLDHLAQEWEVYRPKWFIDKFSHVVKMAKTAMHEGYVVYGSKSLKIKTPYYLTTKFLARINADKLVDKLNDKRELKKTIDEEFYALIDYVDEFKDIFLICNEQQRIIFIENFFRGEENVGALDN
jgi:hypothetical protein